MRPLVDALRDVMLGQQVIHADGLVQDVFRKRLLICTASAVLNQSMELCRLSSVFRNGDLAVIRTTHVDQSSQVLSVKIALEMKQ